MIILIVLLLGNMKKVKKVIINNREEFNLHSNKYYNGDYIIFDNYLLGDNHLGRYIYNRKYGIKLNINFGKK